MMFIVTDSTQDATVTLNNNETGHTEVVTCLNDKDSIAYALKCFAHRQGISVKNVGYEVRYPDA
jgi:hypothetical protein